jgi:hypothetical protein
MATHKLYHDIRFWTDVGDIRLLARISRAVFSVVKYGFRTSARLFERWVFFFTFRRIDSMKLKHNLALVSALALTACGTIFSGSVQNINFSSNVKDVKIYANGALVCSSTPCRVDVDRGSAALTVIAKADGYEDNIMQIKTKINPVS